jgi:hypothetical protein
MPTQSLGDARRFIDSIGNAGGTVPPPLASLLSAADMLTQPSATQDPLQPLLDAAMAGQLDKRKLDKMVAEAAQQQQNNAFRGELATRAERVTVERIHEALADDCADAVLDSLRPQFDKAAEQITVARRLIPAEGDLATWLHRAEPAAVDAWKSLDKHVAVVEGIGRIAAQFGPRGNFALMVECAGGDMYKLHDTAIWCCSGDLEADSAYFHRPGSHRASPWCRTKLELHTVDSAKERYRAWCEIGWDKTHYTRTVQFQKPDGTVGEFELKNPFKAKELA